MAQIEIMELIKPTAYRSFPRSVWHTLWNNENYITMLRSCCDCKHFRMWEPKESYCTKKKECVDPLETTELCWTLRHWLKVKLGEPEMEYFDTKAFLGLACYRKKDSQGRRK